ncbi:hypothetical protein EVAR_12529_1 [Eumeta japonica]|uniref:Uncharacterized protein n=1 Tax=Eumeta variegata TaxID=151549 RepID=A0A4C1TPQ2_EUMVA|nr:hypothetical protein EVAR_12529_1 [Eumeta japonica]
MQYENGPAKHLTPTEYGREATATVISSNESEFRRLTPFYPYINCSLRIGAVNGRCHQCDVNIRNRQLKVPSGAWTESA